MSVIECMDLMQMDEEHTGAGTYQGMWLPIAKLIES